jgi:hypothetical protein
METFGKVSNDFNNMKYPIFFLNNATNAFSLKNILYRFEKI